MKGVPWLQGWSSFTQRSGQTQTLPGVCQSSISAKGIPAPMAGQVRILGRPGMPVCLTPWCHPLHQHTRTREGAGECEQPVTTVPATSTSLPSQTKHSGL